MTTTLSIIGFGAFGRFMASHLKDHFKVLAADHLPIDDNTSRGLGVEPVTIDQAARADIVVFAVPVQGLGEALRHAAPRLRPDAVVIDVCSVKIEPIDLMLRLLPASCRIIGLHPLFGPQSGRDGVAGLPVAFCPAR
ncbi:MAG TPA: prephenate dehydrogenase/arogenate dehydrogenase family protein, partial [Phycisphaerales bacterium]|nr:prephenate dehydrogenase/arogenate dehydrogenase family protein [Phycisphaerales bacterium]